MKGRGKEGDTEALPIQCLWLHRTIRSEHNEATMLPAAAQKL